MSSAIAAKLLESVTALSSEATNSDDQALMSGIKGKLLRFAHFTKCPKIALNFLTQEVTHWFSRAP